MWDIRTSNKKHTHEIATGHKGAITGLAMAPDGNSLLTSSKDSTLALIDLVGLEVRTTFRCSFTHNLTVIDFESFRHDDFRVVSNGCTPTFSPEGRYAACGSSEGAVLVWDTLKDCFVKELSAGAHT